jgi:Ni/Co efflux regulator RcnB
MYEYIKKNDIFEFNLIKTIEIMKKIIAVIAVAIFSLGMAQEAPKKECCSSKQKKECSSKDKKASSSKDKKECAKDKKACAEKKAA